MPTAAVLDYEHIFASRRAAAVAARQHQRKARLRRQAGEFVVGLRGIAERAPAVRRDGSVLYCEALFEQRGPWATPFPKRTLAEQERAIRIKATARSFIDGLRALPAIEGEGH